MIRTTPSRFASAYVQVFLGSGRRGSGWGAMCIVHHVFFRGRLSDLHTYIHSARSVRVGWGRFATALGEQVLDPA